MCDEARGALVVSPLPKTWILDLDGTLVKHNGYRTDGRDTLLDGAREFMDSIGAEDMVIVVTSRTEDCAAETERFLRESGVRFDHIIYGAPYGERILVNDDKPSGLPTALVVRKRRDSDFFPRIAVNESL